MRNYKISRRNFLAVAGTLTAAAALTACGGSASSTVASSTASSSVASDSTPAAASGTGKVTVYMPSPAGLADKLAEGFTAKTGIEVEQFQGTTGEILARLEAEAANPVADVVILASWSDGLSMKADDKLESYTPENADLIVDGWLDDDSVLFGYSASAVGVIYNTTVFSTLDADWKDLGNAEYKDQLDIYYPAGGTIVNPRPAMILKTAPNMDNAKAFVDYLFSDEAQQLVANAYLLPGRTDIKCDKRSNLEDIPQITPDWDKMMAEASDDAAKINQICGASNG